MSKILYMDATDYEYELGNCVVEIYSSVEELKASRGCAAECGIVAVRVEIMRIVEPGIPYLERDNGCGTDPYEHLGEVSKPYDASDIDRMFDDIKNGVI